METEYDNRKCNPLSNIIMHTLITRSMTRTQMGDKIYILAS